MALFQQLFRSLPSWSHDDDRWFATPFSGVYGDPGLAGRTVTKESALAMSAVYACITILSNSIASLPCYIYERQSDGGRRRATERIADRILTRRPNGEMSVFRFKQVVMAHLAAWGNHFSYVERDSRGIRNALWPMFPEHMRIRRNEKTSELEYVFHPPRGVEKVYTSWEIFHVPGWGYNGLVGKSPITLAREAIGLGLAQEEFGARFYGDGTHPGLVAIHPGSPKNETMVNLREALLTQVGGLGKSHRLLMLQDNMKLENISINPVDAEFIVSRKLQLQEVCRFYRMPPHMIADLDRATFSNIEHQSIEFVVHTLGPWLNLLESEFSFFFLTPEERQYYYFEFLVDKFLRGDIKSRYAAYQIARNAGWMNADEIRKKENMDPMEGGLGKIYTVNAGVQSLSWLTDDAAPGEAAPTPFTLANMLRKMEKGVMFELRERINTDVRHTLEGGLADLEERMTGKMSEHALAFSTELTKTAIAIDASFTRVSSLQGEERTKEAKSLMVVVKGFKKEFGEVQKRNASEQRQVWEALKTLPGISDSVADLCEAITTSNTALEAQIEEVKASVTSTSGKLSKKVSRDLQVLTDIANESHARMDDGLTQLSESTTIGDAVSELHEVVTTTRKELVEKLGKIHLDTDPIVDALVKSQEEVEVRFTAVEEAIRAGITPKMLRGVVQEKFSEGIIGLLHRLDSVEKRLMEMVPEDVIKSIVEEASQTTRGLIESSQPKPTDLSPLEGAIKDLDIKIKEGRQEPTDLSLLENSIKDLGARFNEIQGLVEDGKQKPTDLSPLEDAVKDLGARFGEIRDQEPPDLSTLERAIEDLDIKIKEGKQDPVDLSSLESAVKDLGARFNEIPDLVEDGRQEPVDLSPLEGAIKDLDTKIKENRQEPTDLSPLEGAVKDLGIRLDEIRREEPSSIDLSPLENSIKDLGARLEEVQGAVQNQVLPEIPEPTDLSAVEDAIKSLGARNTELMVAVGGVTSEQSGLMEIITKLSESQEQMVRTLGELRSENTAYGKEWGARYQELSDTMASIRAEIDELRALPNLSKEDHARLDELEAKVPELEERFTRATTTRTVANREKVNSQYLPLIQDALQFILNRECISVRRALKKFTGKREEMVRWLDDFYGDHPKFIELKLFRLFSTFLEALHVEIAIDDGGDAGEGLENFIRDHFDGYVERHMAASYGYLKGVAGNEDSVPIADMVDTWHNERAAKAAVEELGRAGEAILAFLESNSGNKGS